MGPHVRAIGLGCIASILTKSTVILSTVLSDPVVNRKNVINCNLSNPHMYCCKKRRQSFSSSLFGTTSSKEITALLVGFALDSYWWTTSKQQNSENNRSLCITLRHEHAITYGFWINSCLANSCTTQHMFMAWTRVHVRLRGYFY